VSLEELKDIQEQSKVITVNNPIHIAKIARLEKALEVVAEVYNYHLKETETSNSPELSTVVSVLFNMQERIDKVLNEGSP
jgi:predicted alternative tryptophan synthase beta-subunit